jgi:hypothetical protein
MCQYPNDLRDSIVSHGVRHINAPATCMPPLHVLFAGAFTGKGRMCMSAHSCVQMG